MAVHVKLTVPGVVVDYPDVPGGDSFRYQVHPSGALVVYRTPGHAKGLRPSEVPITYGPHAWESVTGLQWGGTDDDLDDYPDN